MRSILLTGLVLIGSSVAFAQDATTLPAATQAAVDPLEATARRVDDLSSIFRITVTNGFLSVTTELDPKDTPLRISNPDLPGGGQVTTLVAGAGEDAALRQFSFTTPPDTAPDPSSKTAVSAMANAVHISQFSQNETALWSVQYLQQVPFDPEEAVGADPPVKLYIDRTDVATGLPKLKLKLFAASFDDLRRKYPKEVAQHLAPVLALIQQDASILAPDAALAKRALSDDATVDTDVAKQVNDLVAQLAAAEPDARDKAFASLQSLGEPGTVALSRIDRNGLSAEQNSQIDLLLAARIPGSMDDIKRLGNDPSFLVDCLYLADADLRQVAFKRLLATSKLPLEFDANGSDSARRKQVTAIRAQVLKWAATQPTS